MARGGGGGAAWGWGQLKVSSGEPLAPASTVADFKELFPHRQATQWWVIGIAPLVRMLNYHTSLRARIKL